MREDNQYALIDYLYGNRIQFNERGFFLSKEYYETLPSFNESQGYFNADTFNWKGYAKIQHEAELVYIHYPIFAAGWEANNDHKN